MNFSLSLIAGASVGILLVLMVISDHLREIKMEIKKWRSQ